MSIQVVQAVSGINSFVSDSVGTSAARVFDGTTQQEITQRIQYFRVTNTHATQTIYLGFSSSVTSSLYTAAIAPAGGYFEMNIIGPSDTLLNNIYVIGSGASTTFTLTSLI